MGTGKRCIYRDTGEEHQNMKTTALIIVSAAVVVCQAALIICEKKSRDVRKLVLTGVMTSLSVAGRFVFAPFPGFKPVTAMVVLTGMYLGRTSGFMCGALTALISNFYFGQGPWTPFQMLVWGTVGVISGYMQEILKSERTALVIFGIGAGILYSFLMDIYTVIWTIGRWSWTFYLTAIASAVPYTVIYAVSNVIFLLAIEKPLGEKMGRIYKKYCFRL